MTSKPNDWDTIFHEQLPRIYNYFLYRVNERSLAEDLTSITFERAWQSRENYRHNLGAFSTWLFTIAHHVAVDYFRKKKPKLISIDELHNISDDNDPDTVVQAITEAEELAQAIAKLPEREQEIIALKYGAGMNNRVIARLLDLKESNIGTIIHRAVKQLRISLIEAEKVEEYG